MTPYSRFLPFGVAADSANTFASAAEKALQSVAGAQYHDARAEQLIASLADTRRTGDAPEVFVVHLSTAAMSTAAISTRLPLSFSRLLMRLNVCVAAKLVSETLRAMPAHYVVALIGNAAGERRRQAQPSTTMSTSPPPSTTMNPTPAPSTMSPTPVPTPAPTPAPIDYGGAPPGVWDCIVLSLFFLVITIAAFQRMCILQTPTHFVALKKTK
jgi:hypothetical protein